MKKNSAYLQLLRKMLTIEAIGTGLYQALSSKTNDKNLKSLYQELALNERQTARYIEEELVLINRNFSVSTNDFFRRFIQFTFRLLSLNQLSWILKKALKRKMFSRWFVLYRDRNQQFWDKLLNHENMQHELLKPLWNKQ